MNQTSTLRFLLSIVLMMTMLGWCHAQISITGRIVSEDSPEGLPGVNVVVKGTTQGAATDVDGNYTISVPSRESILVFSFVGYATQEVTVGDQTTIDVTLMPDITSLNEVRVVGYGTTLKKNVTTSIAHVDPENIPNAANEGASDLLFGKAAGVQVDQYSAQPGGRVDLSIRGRRGAPLVVVDGVIVPTDALESGVNHSEIDNVKRGNLGGLNPNDIESIELLKDASAAIYGVNAANGVILITTKKGAQGKVKVNYNGSRSFLSNYDYLEPLGPRDYMELYNQLDKDRYLAENDMAPFGPNAASGFTPKFTQDDINNNTTNTDWVGQVLRNGSIDNHNLNISGGTENITYYFSGGYFNQVGTVENSDLEKYSGKFDLTFKLNKLFTLKASAFGNKSNFSNTVAGWQTGGAGPNGFTALQSALAYPTYLPIRDPSTGKYTQFQLQGNPVAQLDIMDKSDNFTLFTNLSLDVNFIPDKLKGTIRFGDNYEKSLRNFFIPSTTNWFDDYRARASLQQRERQNVTFETFLTYDERLGDFLNLNLVGGFGQYTTDEFGFGVQSFDMLDVINTTRINGSPTNGNSNKNKNKLRSYFVRGSFDVYDKYLLTAAWRYDGFSQFFPESKYAGFPSVSAGWKISNEPFLSGADFFDLLKIRASIGTTGQNLPSGVAYGVYSPDGDIVSYNDNSANYIPYLLTQIDHPNLTWEKTIMKNIGLDFELFQSRLAGSVEWYKDDVTNLLRTGVNTPALSFIPTQPVNGGHQVRTGVDVLLTGDIVRSSKLSWEMTVNLSHYKYNWVERFEEDDPSTYLNVDDPVRAMYAFETNGILQLGDTPSAYQPSAATTPGSPLFIDQNGDDVLDSADVIVYDQTPKLNFGFNNTFRFGNFDLSIFLYGQLGSYKQNYSLNWARPLGILNGNSAGTQNTHDVWSSDNPGGTLPGSTYDEALLANIGNTINWGSDFTISKADFLRARNITLGYTFRPGKYFDHLRIYADVQNAFLITGYKGGDPEVASPGVKGAAAPYPVVRSYSVGVNLNF